MREAHTTTAILRSRLADGPTGLDSRPFRWGGNDDRAQVLIQGAALGDIEVVRFALDAGCSPDAPGVLGDGTALLVAAARGHLAVVNALLSAGARIDVGREGTSVTARDPRTEVIVTMPIFVPEAAVGLAAANGHDEVVARLDAEERFRPRPISLGGTLRSDDEQAIVNWLADQRQTLVLDGMQISCSPALFNGAVVVCLPVLADRIRTAELCKQWPHISWITERDNRNHINGFVPCQPALASILEALRLGRRIRGSWSMHPELN